MIEFGKTLKEAREQKGYSISQLAEITRMIHQTIEDLENENFTRIAAPIYGRGFVKLYCEAVGIDPKPMVAEFMEIFNGNRELGIKERIVQKQSAEPPAQEPVLVEKPAERLAETPVKKPVETEILFSGDSVSEPLACEPPKAAPYSFKAFGDPDPAEEKAASEPVSRRLSRYASPLREAQLPKLPTIPPAVWRIAALAIGALAILWVLSAGLKALYRATSGSSRTHEESAEVSAAPATERAKVDIPSLYVD